MSNLTDTLSNLLTSAFENNRTNMGDILTDFLHQQGISNNETWTPATHTYKLMKLSDSTRSNDGAILLVYKIYENILIYIIFNLTN